MVIFPLNNKKAPAVPQGTNWQDYQGEVKSSLIGIMIPKGVVVIDIDTHKGCTTEQVDAALGVQLNWDLSELQTTMNGGKHYVFRIPENADLPNGTNLLGVTGFDTRASFKGYIATGKGYTNLTLLPTVQEALHDATYWTELPQEAIDKLLGGRAAVSTNSAGDAEVSDLEAAINSQPLDLTEEEVCNYVGKLTEADAEDGSTWLKVGMGIYHQCEGAEWGWELFDEFSKLSADKYDENNNRKRWDSFGKNRDRVVHPVTFASVIELAGGVGIVESDRVDALRVDIATAPDKQRLTELVREIARMKLDELNNTIITKALQKRFSDVVGEKFTESQIRRVIRKSRHVDYPDYYEDYVYLTATAEYMERETKTTMSQRAFDVKHDRHTPSDGDGNPQRASMYVNNKIECVHSGMYAPMFDDFFTYDGVDYFNTFKHNPLKPVPHGKTDIVERIKKHIAHLLPDPIEQDLVINYLAHNVQFKGRKMQWAMVLQGVQGDGKSFFAEMMKHVLGFTNCRTVTVESLDEKFTSWAEGSCMVFIEELKLDNYKKYETLNKLKPYIVNPTVSIRRMQRDVYEAINTTNYFALTNFKDALPIDDNDRRYCILFSQWQSREALEGFINENPNYYSALYDDMRANVGEILHWLLTHTIPDSFKSLNRAPQTNSKAAMLELNRSEGYLLVEDAIEEFNGHDINDYIVNVTRLTALATSKVSLEYQHFPKNSTLQHILTDMGYHNIGRYKNKSRKNQTIYCKDHKKLAIDFAEQINSAGDDDPFA